MHSSGPDINWFRRTGMTMAPLAATYITKLMTTCASNMVAALILFNKKIAIFAFHEMQLMLYDGDYCKVTSNSFLMSWIQTILTVLFHTGDTEQILFSFQFIQLSFLAIRAQSIRFIAQKLQVLKYSPISYFQIFRKRFEHLTLLIDGLNTAFKRTFDFFKFILYFVRSVILQTIFTVFMSTRTQGLEFLRTLFLVTNMALFMIRIDIFINILQTFFMRIFILLQVLYCYNLLASFMRAFNLGLSSFEFKKDIIFEAIYTRFMLAKPQIFKFV